MQDHCTALEKAADGGCVFYKDAENNRREIRRCFYRLIRHERFDLLGKYADTLAALGFMDEEMADAARQHDDLEKYWPSLSCGSPSTCHGGKGSFWAHEVLILCSLSFFCLIFPLHNMV